MLEHTCEQCGARYESLDDSCAERFSVLLAFDHSRQEPWGSRHGSAFAAYTLQHPVGIPHGALDRCWVMLYRIWIAGDDPDYVARKLRHPDRGGRSSWDVPALPANALLPRRAGVTIADLGDFDAETYPTKLEAWCRATLEALGQAPTTA
jgi:hypothetical protein